VPFLFNRGFSTLAGLDEYVNVRSLFLQNNALRCGLGRLGNMTQLKLLYIDHNVMESLTGLGCLKNLEQLHASHNKIKSK
jgi:Leucine-rich repeat (LRR) protein